MTNTHDNLTILHLDAHPDLYDSYDGSRFSHACPFARIMETGRVKRLVQVGIRGMNDEQRRQVDKFGVTCIEMKDYRSKNPIALEGPLYLSVDMDVLDPAYAPGVSHHEPGGMSTRKVLRLIQSITMPHSGGGYRRSQSGSGCERHDGGRGREIGKGDCRNDDFNGSRSIGWSCAASS